MKQKLLLLINIYAVLCTIWAIMAEIAPIHYRISAVADYVVQSTSFVLFAIVIYWFDVKKSEWKQNLAIALLLANSLYFIGTSAAILELVWMLLYIFLIKKERIALRDIGVIAFDFIISLEIYSFILLLFARDTDTWSTRMLVSVWLDILFAIALLIYCQRNQVLAKLSGWNLKKRAFPSISQTTAFLLVGCLGILSVVSILGWYKLYMKNLLYSCETFVNVDAEMLRPNTDGNGNVRAIRPNDIPAMEPGEYTISIDYITTNPQVYELLYIHEDWSNDVILSGTLDPAANHIDLTFRVDERYPTGLFCPYLDYDGQGSIESTGMTVSKDGQLIQTIPKEEIVAPYLVGFDGIVDKLYLPYARMECTDIPKGKHLMLKSTDFDPDNYIYQIWTYDEAGEQIVLQEYDKNASDTAIHTDIKDFTALYEDISSVYVDVYRVVDDGNPPMIMVDNEDYVYGFRPCAKVGMLLIAVITALACLLLLIDQKNHAWAKKMIWTVIGIFTVASVIGLIIPAIKNFAAMGVYCIVIFVIFLLGLLRIEEK